MVDPAFLSALRQWVELSTEQSTDDILHYSRETGLSVIHLNVLFYVSHQQTLPVSEIAAKLGITRSAASQLIDHLVKKGYLSRKEGYPDRRLRQIRLAEKGLALVKEFDEARFHWIVKMGSALSPAQKESIIHSLSELAEAARKIGGGEDDNQQKTGRKK